jgi:flagellar hook-associated protein 2
MSFTPLTFTGISSYSSDFQTVLDRAVKIASLPLQALQNENADLLARKTQLSSIGNSVSGLTNAFQSLVQVSEGKALQATSSNTAVATVANASATAAATYTINEVTSLAAAASETSVSGYATSQSTQVSASGTVLLTVGTSDYTLNLSPGSNNLAGLRDAINSLGVGVTASIITTGTGANPNYLSISANTPGATTLKLIEDPNGTPLDLITNSNQGSNTEFKLNGLTVIRKSNQVNDVVPGLSFNLLAESNTPVTLTLSTQKSQLINSLNDFVSAFNTLTNSVSSQIGPAAGLLSGDFLVREVQKAQREVSGYVSDAGLALSDLGITFDATGKASFDNAKVQAFTDQQLQDAFSFLGTDTTGFGKLATRFSEISDPVSGLIQLQQASYDKSDMRLQSQIADLEGRIDNMQKSAALRLQQIDALLGTLESQQRVIDASIQAVNFTLFGKKES